MKSKLFLMIATAKKHLEGYPMVTETAPKTGRKPFKVNRNDPKFDRPLSELTSERQ